MIQEVRSFNRFYTNLIGALDYSRHLHAPYTLTESRVLYELAHSAGTDAADLRSELSLDAGYLSRILGKFEKDELVESGPSARDPRRRRVTLTERGREAAAVLDERSREAVATLLAEVPASAHAPLTEALHTVRETLERGGDEAARTRRGGEVLLRGPAPGDLGWIVERNGALYAAEFGWNSEYEALVARIVADFAQDHDPDLEQVWIAELDGRRVGCVLCVRDREPGAARLRLLLVEPDARGHGVGDQLIRACVDFARRTGYRELVLWTNDVLRAAATLYRRHGFELIAEQPHHSFGADLVGHDYRLRLDEPEHKQHDKQEAPA
ncbi:MarR family transcriptional regulator [Streptomyces sp. NA04227]|uniref:bifunctional helix-turn-helix transcriptional regulator/GNAT family N-acetyltransferase n=1 Tax=Streptomyces sp. NA04227 TaxID=2742136 RepID=UPI00159230EB|nr:bifunctional helix-turn-helix transcriptional regulator/GNAT family N-acetyltransferase [Streptomyces sp. NA04227]QKW08809.1 MarR family transcriptional regulator [Streptomyces sp. NA04227]